MQPDLESHKLYVANSPHKSVPARALVDHVQDESGCTRMAALRCVARILFAKRKARRLAVAARWLSNKGEVGRFIRREIARSYPTFYPRNALRVLVDGFHVPRLWVKPYGTGKRAEGRWAVTVTAGWVIVQVAHWFDARCGSLAMHRAKRGP